MENKQFPRFSVALEKARAACARQEQCRHDIEKKLYTLGLQEKEISNIIGELIKEKFLDDKRYAAAYVKDKFRFNKWGRLKIRHGLALKKLPHEIIEHALENISEDDYRKMLGDELKKKTKNLKGTHYARKAKLMRFAQSRGFEPGVVYEIIDRIAGGGTYEVD